MALVESLVQVDKQRTSVHQPVRCTWTLVKGHGQKYIQIDTYGSEERKYSGTVTQSVQFSKESASQLLKVIHETFPELVRINKEAAVQLLKLIRETFPDLR